MATVAAALVQTGRGIATALRSRKSVVLWVTAAVALFNLLVPIAVLSIARKPPDFITFNPWLRKLPEYLGSSEPLLNKLSFLSHMAIGWVSADNGGEIVWGFILDMPTIARIVAMSLVFGTYFALWSYRREIGVSCGVPHPAAKPAGVVGAMTTVFGLTTGPCTLAGCGVPVLPVVGLAFTGLESGTLTMFSSLSRISVLMVLAVMAVAVVWSGWRAGEVVSPQPAGTTTLHAA
ncbi:MAG: hypothetical protein ACJ79O_18660 [Myxococcales bacterium]